MRKRLLYGAVAALGLAVAAGTPAVGLTGVSQPDVTHSNVGVLLPSPSLPLPKTCGVTLVSSRVGVMAGHCVALLALFTGEDDGTLTFDADLRDGVSAPTYHGSLVLDPMFSLSGFRHDVGLIVLDQPVSGVTPEPLAPLGYLDSVEPASTMAEIVGYGTTVRDPGNVLSGSGQRRAGWAFVDGITPLQLRLHATGSTATASGCDLDSGSPVFVHDVFSAVVSHVDGACSSMTVGQRIDTAFEGGWIRSVIAANG